MQFDRADYIGFLCFFFFVGVVAGSLGVWVVIVESVGDGVGAAIGSGVIVGCGIVLGGTSVVFGAGVEVCGAGIVCGSPGAGAVVCANAAVESVAAARPAKSAIRIKSDPFGTMTIEEVVRNNAPTDGAVAPFIPMRERLARLPDLPAMQQLMVGQHQGDHRRDDWRATNADARIVPALGQDLGCGAATVDRLDRG